MKASSELLNSEPFVSLIRRLDALTTTKSRADYLYDLVDDLARLYIVCEEDDAQASYEGLVGRAVELAEIKIGILSRRINQVVARIRNQERQRETGIELKLKTTKGKVDATLDNIDKILLAHFGNTIKKDKFTNYLMSTQLLPWEKEHKNDDRQPDPEGVFGYKMLSDVDITNICVWLSRVYKMPVSGMKLIEKVVHSVAARNAIDVYQMQMDAKPKWDGIPRIQSAPVEYFGADPDSEHAWIEGMAFYRFMIAKAARCYQPGCHMRTALVLVGPQEIGKGRLCEVLSPFSKVFGGKDINLNDRDTYLPLAGASIVEMSESIHYKKSDADTFKSFLSTSRPIIRQLYGSHYEVFPLRNVFVMSLNPDADGVIATDYTGNTRLWPIIVGAVKPPRWRFDFAKIMEVVDQWDAEAIHRYRQGELWWFDTDKEREAQAAYTATMEPENPAVHDVLRYIEDNPTCRDGGITLGKVRDWMAEIKSGQRYNEKYVIRALKDIGWEQKRVRLSSGENGRRQMIWFPSGRADPQERRWGFDGEE